MEVLEEKRTYIGFQVYDLAAQYNIAQSTVKQIINSYIDYCKGRLVQGYRVDFFGLVSLIPEGYGKRLSETLAKECINISDELCLPRNTVFIIIRAYIDDLINSVLNGRVAEVRGLFSVHPISKNGYYCVVHSSISQSLRWYLSDRGCKSVRVHAYKMLKDSMKEGKVAYDGKDT